MTSTSRRRVRLWFGPHLIGDYIGDVPSAARHEAAMRRRFPGLDTTNDPVSIAPSSDGRDYGRVPGLLDG